MRHFLILLKHELRMLLISPTTYIAGFLFLALMGLLYWIILNEMSTTALEELPHVEFFKGFWIPTFFVIPLLTMRSIAGERSSGTLDTLLTTPTSRISVVLSKFTGAYLFYLLLQLKLRKYKVKPFQIQVYSVNFIFFLLADLYCMFQKVGKSSSSVVI